MKAINISNLCCKKSAGGIVPTPMPVLRNLFILSEEGDCPTPANIQYAHKITGVVGNDVVVNTALTPTPIATAQGLLYDELENITQGELCNNPEKDSWTKTFGVLNSADRWRINGGATIMFLNGMQFGDNIISGIGSNMAQPNIENIARTSQNVATILTTLGQVTSIEVSNDGIIWDGFNASIDPTVKSPCYTCYAVEMLATNCNGVSPATIASNQQIIKVVPIISKPFDLIFDITKVQVMWDIFSPFSDLIIDNIIDETGIYDVLTNDPSKPSEITYLSVYSNGVQSSIGIVTTDTTNIGCPKDVLNADISAIKAKGKAGALLKISGCNFTSGANFGAFLTSKGHAGFTVNGYIKDGNDEYLNIEGLPTINANTFLNNTAITEFNDMGGGITSIGDNCFDGCINVENINIKACTTLGTTVGDNSIFNGCVLLSTLTVNANLFAVNAGLPDGDISYADATFGTSIIYA